jgi:hypothetical protein
MHAVNHEQKSLHHALPHGRGIAICRNNPGKGKTDAAGANASNTGQGPSSKVRNLRRLSLPPSILPFSSRTAILPPHTRKLHWQRMQ